MYSLYHTIHGSATHGKRRQHPVACWPTSKPSKPAVLPRSVRRQRGRRPLIISRHQGPSGTTTSNTHAAQTFPESPRIITNGFAGSGLTHGQTHVRTRTRARAHWTKRGRSLETWSDGHPSQIDKAALTRHKQVSRHSSEAECVGRRQLPADRRQSPMVMLARRLGFPRHSKTRPLSSHNGCPGGAAFCKAPGQTPARVWPPGRHRGGDQAVTGHPPGADPCDGDPPKRSLQIRTRHILRELGSNAIQKCCRGLWGCRRRGRAVH